MLSNTALIALLLLLSISPDPQQGSGPARNGSLSTKRHHKRGRGRVEGERKREMDGGEEKLAIVVKHYWLIVVEMLDANQLMKTLFRLHVRYSMK